MKRLWLFPRRGLKKLRLPLGLIAASAASLLTVLVVPLFTSRHNTIAVQVVDSETVDAFASLLPDEIAVEIASEPNEDEYTEDQLSDLVAPEWLLTAVDLDTEDKNVPAQNDGIVF